MKTSMRQFHSYGPVDPDQHFAVPRRALVEDCVQRLVGPPNKTGHFFTIWAARQTGKTWLMRQAISEIRARYGDRFLVKELSMQGVSLPREDPAQAFLAEVPGLFEDYLGLKIPQPQRWRDWGRLFTTTGGIFDRPLILLIDEFDRLPPPGAR